MSQCCGEKTEVDGKKREKPFEIKSDSLLLVEGKDEGNFFCSLLKKMGIKAVEIHEAEGNSQFLKKLEFLVSVTGFSKVRKLGFVRDAEKNKAKSAFDSICTALENVNILERLPNSIGKVENIGIFKVGIFIMPNNRDSGMLETLCLQSIEGMHCNKEMQAYIECLKKFYENNPSFNLEKAKTQVYLASKVPIRNSLGLGACKGYWNFDHCAFDEIKLFLNELFGNESDK